MSSTHPFRPRPVARLILVPLVWGTLCPAHAAAQETVRPGTEVTGVLEAGDPLDGSGARYDAFRIPGGMPGLLAITAESDAFDTHLQVGIVVEGEFTGMLANDDFGGLAHPTDSRIFVEGDNDWVWEVRVSSYAPEEAGPYRLKVETLRGGDPVPQRTVYGADIQGALDLSDGFAFQSFQDWYRFRGSAGDRVKVVLEATFDGYVILRPVNGPRLAEDDNGFGGTDAYLEASLPTDGEYEVVVRSRVPALGAYRLRLGPELDVTPPERPGEAAPVLQASGADEALPLGEWVSGSLDEGDARDVDGRVFDGFYAPAGVTGVFAVTVESAVFDAEIEAGPSAQGRYTGLQSADDAPGLASPTDARLYLGLRQGQVFELRVRSALGDAAGAYRIRMDPVEVGDGEPVEIAMGADITGELGEGDAFVFGTFLDRYHFRGQAGELVEVAVDGAFDPYLALGLADGGGVAEDDDSLDGEGAWLAVVLPADGLYEIQVSASGSGTGGYRLRLGRGLRPDAPVPGSGLTDQERSGLMRDGDRFRNEALGFDFPAPSATLSLLPPREGVASVPDLHTWYLSEEDGARQLMVIAHRTVGPARVTSAVDFVEGLLGSLPFQVVASRPAWFETLSGDYVLEAPNGVRADLRCQASPAARDPGLVVCLLATATEGAEFRELLAELRVR